MSQQPGILIPADWAEAFAEMPDRDVGIIIKAALAVSAGKEPKTVPRGSAAGFYTLFVAQMERQQKKYSDVVEKRRNAARARWEKANQSKPDSNEYKPMQVHTKCNTPESNDPTPSLQTPENRNRNRNRNRKISKDIIKKWLRRCIGRFYRRRASTRWSDAEERKLAAVADRPDALRECRDILRLYRSGYQYARRDIVTLLNNWTGELDRAAAAPAAAGIASSQRFSGFSPNQRGLR